MINYIVELVLLALFYYYDEARNNLAGHSMNRAFPLTYAIGFGALMGAITLTGLLANLVVMVAILGDRKMRKSTMNLLLLNLVSVALIHCGRMALIPPMQVRASS